jgi:signal transduction protein with GAF and PtsI domain
LRFLQQENIRLQKTIEALEQTNLALARYLEMVQELYWTGQTIGVTENPLETIDQLLEKVMKVCGAHDGSLLILNKKHEELIFVFSHGDLRQQLPGHRLNSTAGIAGWVVEHGQPIIVNNPRQDWRFSVTIDQTFGFLTRSIVSVPMLKKGEVMGVLQLLNKYNNEFIEADVALLLIYGQVAAMLF